MALASSIERRGLKTPQNAPTIVLMHGFPSSSHEFDTLIPLLAVKYHLIAPDYPGFGLRDARSPARYAYTFDHLAQTMSDFLAKLKVNKYTMYLHDYGAPIGFRIILESSVIRLMHTLSSSDSWRILVR